MGRSVSYPTGSVVAFRLLDEGEDDDVDWVYECLRRRCSRHLRPYVFRSPVPNARPRMPRSPGNAL